jgi:serine/threonine-protein kinase
MSTIGHYDIERPVLRSNHYTVFLARDKRTRDTVEIWWCDKPVSPDKFHFYLVRLQQFRNHRIADVLDGDITEGGAAWIACEHFDGVSLGDLVSQTGPSPAIFAIDFVLDLCIGLREAHAEGLYHGDIHPYHVIGIEDEQVRLCGLGIVQLFGLPQRAAMAAPAFRAPEVIGGFEVTFATDIYSIGLLLYQWIAGRAAFKNNILRVLNDPPKPLEGGDVNYAWPVIERAIAKHPADRYRSMGEFLAVLHRAHARCEEWFDYVLKSEATPPMAEAFRQAHERIAGQRAYKRKSGFDWGKTFKKINRPLEMPPRMRSHDVGARPFRRPFAWRALALGRNPAGAAPAQPLDAAPVAPAQPLDRRRRLRRAVEVGILTALICVAFLSSRTSNAPQRASLAMPSISLAIVTLDRSAGLSPEPERAMPALDRSAGLSPEPMRAMPALGRSAGSSATLEVSYFDRM